MVVEEGEGHCGVAGQSGSLLAASLLRLLANLPDEVGYEGCHRQQQQAQGHGRIAPNLEEDPVHVGTDQALPDGGVVDDRQGGVAQKAHGQRPHQEAVPVRRIHQQLQPTSKPL